MGAPKADGFIRKAVGSDRITVLPALPAGVIASEKQAVEVAMASNAAPSSLGVQALSTVSTAPAFTMSAPYGEDPLLREKKKLILMSQLPPAPMGSSMGSQTLSRYRNAPSAAVGAGPSRAQVADLQLKHLMATPSPAAYGAGDLSVLSTTLQAPAVRIPRVATHIDDPMTAGRPVPGLDRTALRGIAQAPGPGQYKRRDGIGGALKGPTLGDRSRRVKEIPAMSGAAARAARGDAKDADLISRTRLSAYAAAHDRRQPMTPRR
jgi:hypothetical protein